MIGKQRLLAWTACMMGSFAVSGVVVGADPAPTMCYQNAAGQSIHLLDIHLDQLPAGAVTAHQHVILVDTSASQMGEHRAQALRICREVLAGLPAGEQVSIRAVDLRSEPLHAGFVAPDSQEARSALAALDSRIPAGSTRLREIMESLVTEFPSGVTSVFYIGDGITGTGIISPEAMEQLCVSLNKHQIIVSAYANGPRKDLELLGVLAARTGGVVIEDHAGQDDLQVAGKLINALTSPVWFPQQMIPELAGLTVLPAVAQPVRTDRETCYLVALPEGTAARELNFNLVEGNESVQFHQSLGQPETSQAWLGGIWERAVATNGTGVPLAGIEMGQYARAGFDASMTRLVDQGKKALQERRFDEAREVAQYIKAVDPGNDGARSIMTVADRVEARPVAMLQGNPEDLKSRTDAPDARESNPINKLKGIQQAAGERLRLKVSQSLEEIQRTSQTDPASALDLLKRVKGMVDSATDVDPSVISQLDRKLSQTLLEISSRKTRVELEQIKGQERLAELEARNRVTEAMILEEQRLQQLIDQVRSLIEVGRHGDDYAYEKAESVAVAAVNLRPGNAPATVARFVSEATGQLNSAFRLRELRADRYLQTLTQVELSHVPFPDEPPVRYPPSEVWRSLTERRRKWASVDLRKVGPNEARIEKALEEETEFEFVDTPLKNVMDNIAELHRITIYIDETALTDIGVSIDQPVNLTLSGITLKSALRIMLEPDELTWVIENEVMKITTQTEADSVLETRVYPVGDLVVPVLPPGGGQGGGQGGFGGGGQGGFGGGGGGQGGFGGGGQGGGGGGFFSIPPMQPDLLKKKP